MHLSSYHKGPNFRRTLSRVLTISRRILRTIPIYGQKARHPFVWPINNAGCSQLSELIFATFLKQGFQFQDAAIPSEFCCSIILVLKT